MRKRNYLYLIPCLVLLMFLPGVAAAQDGAPRSEFYGGYSILLTEGVLDLGLGGDFSYTHYLNRNFGIEANGAVYSTPFLAFTSNSQFALAGPKVIKRWRWISVHAHALGGVGHHTSLIDPILFPGVEGSSTGFAWAAGGGIDLNFTKNVGLRLLQIDYTRMDREQPTIFRPTSRGTFVVGVVISWGNVD